MYVLRMCPQLAQFIAISHARAMRRLCVSCICSSTVLAMLANMHGHIQYKQTGLVGRQSAVKNCQTNSRKQHHHSSVTTTGRPSIETGPFAEVAGWCIACISPQRFALGMSACNISNSNSSGNALSHTQHTNQTHACVMYSFVPHGHRTRLCVAANARQCRQRSTLYALKSPQYVCE